MAQQLFDLDGEGCFTDLDGENSFTDLDGNFLICTIAGFIRFIFRKVSSPP